ncbi:hypothetical protein EIN_185390 [Entamoeba invadens IP1]|uniref:hypothetical protein n=1 Tax=Entamoeba invadens IP1 TaxID=370355 RepID=UPI0002C3E7D3|nr:hypothetical protein EIN_185390 [Entamoeba invadens IP1]ELP94152.1 hypothetical protein EIN_185390 [Entamoeba invadens IP1]|eukprot:XP_004260923.1 hypothetical protein EIN_185390 [Entamoeba invadens IP1]
MEFRASDFGVKRKKKAHPKPIPKRPPSPENVLSTISVGGIGEEMLKSMGWSEGKGVGKYEQGIQAPIKPASTANREGVDSVQTTQRRDVDLKLLHYGEEAKTENIEELIELENGVKETTSKVEDLKEQITLTKTKIQRALEDSIQMATTIDEKIEDSHESTSWCVKGVEIITQISNDLNEVTNPTTCITYLQQIVTWLNKGIDTSLINRISSYLINSLLLRAVDELEFVRTTWRIDNAVEGPYYELMQSAQALCTPRFLGITKQLSDSLALNFFKENVFPTLQKNVGRGILFLKKWKILMSDEGALNIINLITEYTLNTGGINDCFSLMEEFDGIGENKLFVEKMTTLITQIIKSEQDCNGIVAIITKTNNYLSKTNQTKLHQFIVSEICERITKKKRVDALKELNLFESLFSQDELVLFCSKCLLLSDTITSLVWNKRDLKFIIDKYTEIRSYIKPCWIKNDVERILREWLTSIDSYTSSLL